MSGFRQYSDYESSLLERNSLKLSFVLLRHKAIIQRSIPETTAKIDQQTSHLLKRASSSKYGTEIPLNFPTSKIPALLNKSQALRSPRKVVCKTLPPSKLLSRSALILPETPSNRNSEPKKPLKQNHASFLGSKPAINNRAAFRVRHIANFDTQRDSHQETVNESSVNGSQVLDQEFSPTRSQNSLLDSPKSILRNPVENLRDSIIEDASPRKSDVGKRVRFSL